MKSRNRAAVWVALGVIGVVLSLGTAVGAELKKPAGATQMPTQGVAPAQSKVPMGVKTCEGPDPAVIGLKVERTNQGRRGYLTVFSTTRNIGTQDFVSGPNQASVTVQVYDARQSGPAAYATVKTQQITRLNRGASVDVRADPYRIDNFIEWGHRTARSGECQAERDAIVFLNYDPDILSDGNPRNDDCNVSNNRRIVKVPFMVECPW